MSRQMVISFLGKLDGDASMQAQVKNLEGDLPGLIGLAARAGFVFAPEDWNGTIADLAAKASGALEDRDLEKVAGGAVGPPFLVLRRNTYLASFVGSQFAMKI